MNNLNTIPKDWKWVKLGAVCNIVYGKGLPTKNLKENGYPVFGANGIIGCNDKYLYEESMVLISCRGAYSGKINFSPPKCYVTNNSLILIVKSNNELDKNYLYYSLTAAKKTKLVTGTAQPQVTINNAIELDIPLPPRATQQSIVSKIEELLSELDKGIENLRLAQQQLKTYRQAVLKWAFAGKLTEEWRKKTKGFVANLQFRSQMHGSDVRVPTGSPDETPVRIRSGPPPENGGVQLNCGALDGRSRVPDTSGQQENRGLPEGWERVKMGEIVEKPKYGTSKKCDYKIDGKGVLRIPNISNGIVDSTDLKFAAFDKSEIETYCLKEGDILTIRSNGSVDLVGKCALISKRDEEFLYAGYLIRLRPLRNFVLPKYLVNVLSSIDLRSQIEEKAKSTSGVNNINSEELGALIISLPTIAEQEQIVQEIEDRLSITDKMEETITQGLQQAEALRQSILKKAFEGKLI